MLETAQNYDYKKLSLKFSAISKRQFNNTKQMLP